MESNKNFDKWRAEKLGYVYFSRLSDLIINEPNFQEPLFDYLIDIGEDHRPMGRLFGVEVKALNNNGETNVHLSTEYKNISFPALLVMFDNKNDHGYFKWIKKPIDGGQLSFDSAKNDVEELNDSSLEKIVTDVKDWYSKQHVA